MEKIHERDVTILNTIYQQPGRVEVFEVKHIQSGKILCLKKLYIDKFEEITNIYNEFMAMAYLQHPNLVQLISVSFGGYGKQIVSVDIFTEFYREGDLEKFIQYHQKQRSYLSEVTILKYLNQLVDGFAFMQEREIAHRDIKPQNIFLDQNATVLKIGDFGSATKNEVGRYSQVLGTPLYLSPEVRKYFNSGMNLFGVKDNPYKSDVYSLGLTFLYLASLIPVNNLSNLANLQEMIQARISDIKPMYPNLCEYLGVMITFDEYSRKDFLGLRKMLNRKISVSVLDSNAIKNKICGKVSFSIGKCCKCNIEKSEDSLYCLYEMLICKECYKIKFLDRVEKRELFYVSTGIPYLGTGYCGDCKGEKHEDSCRDNFIFYKREQSLYFLCDNCNERILFDARLKTWYSFCSKGHYCCVVCMKKFNESDHEVCKNILKNEFFA